jgi:hypothetical protein
MMGVSPLFRPAGKESCQHRTAGLGDVRIGAQRIEAVLTERLAFRKRCANASSNAGSPPRAVRSAGPAVSSLKSLQHAQFRVRPWRTGSPAPAAARLSCMAAQPGADGTVRGQQRLRCSPPTAPAVLRVV